VAYAIVPVFALANAGLGLGGGSLARSLDSPIALGIFAGLVVGKFTGISAASFVAVRLGWARLPAGVGWRHVLGAAWLGGIGFTMSLFVSELAFDRDGAELAKAAILAASLASAVIGMLWLVAVTRRRG
jgi:NhaA family Na+:H+ antiporter